MKERRTVVLSQNDAVRKIVVIFENGIVDIWRKAYGDDESIDMVRLTKEEFEKLKEIDVL